jgi:hypothetical protein
MADKQVSRAQQWALDLDAAGVNEAEAKKVFNAVRDDPRATQADREEFYSALAQQSFIWYVECLRGSQLTEEEFDRFVKEMQNPPEAEA